MPGADQPSGHKQAIVLGPELPPPGCSHLPRALTRPPGKLDLAALGAEGASSPPQPCSPRPIQRTGWFPSFPGPLSPSSWGSVAAWFWGLGRRAGMDRWWPAPQRQEGGVRHLRLLRAPEGQGPYLGIVEAPGPTQDRLEGTRIAFVKGCFLKLARRVQIVEELFSLQNAARLRLAKCGEIVNAKPPISRESSLQPCPQGGAPGQGPRALTQSLSLWVHRVSVHR